MKEKTNNRYAMFLEAQGVPVISVDGVDWWEYSGFMMPAYLPHCVPKISDDTARKVLKKSGKLFVRWDSKFGLLEKSPWWYVLKKGHWDIADIKNKKKRWMIRKGKKNFNVRPLNFEEVVNFCPAVAKAAAARYKGEAKVECREEFEKRIMAEKQVSGVIEYIGCFSGDKVVSFCESYIQENAVWMTIIRHVPEYLDKYSSYALLDGILEYYLNKKGMFYVLDGSRSIHHRTNFQEQLMSVFDFTKEYASLNICYSTNFSVILNTAWCFRKTLWYIQKKLQSHLLDNIGAVLLQEDIVRKSSNL